MNNERLVTLLYNAITFLMDEKGSDREEIMEALGITVEEYNQIMDDYKDTVCCTFGEDKLREDLFRDNESKN